MSEGIKPFRSKELDFVFNHLSAVKTNVGHVRPADPDAGMEAGIPDQGTPDQGTPDSGAGKPDQGGADQGTTGPDQAVADRGTVKPDQAIPDRGTPPDQALPDRSAAGPDLGATGDGLARCKPMDAMGDGPCDMHIGVKWDGKACVNVSGCRCLGTDCSRLFKTKAACQAAYAGCP